MRAAWLTCVVALGCGRVDFEPYTAFTPIVLPAGGSMSVVVHAPDGTVYAGTGTRLWRSSNEGATWTECGRPNVEVASLIVDPASGALYAGGGQDGGGADVAASRDRCASWTVLGLHRIVHGLAMLGSEVLAGA